MKGDVRITPTNLLFFWDYDTQWGADADRSNKPWTNTYWHQFEMENTERLLDLHAKYNVPACFAVVGAAALPGDRPYCDPSQIRRIHAEGHEIASHTFHHEWLPGLDKPALRQTLHRSKDALEQCIGAPVVSFVPPYNQPYDYARGWSFSLSERRGAGRERTDLRRLCEALRESGYGFCRVAYLPMHVRVAERLLRRRLDRHSRPEVIAGVTCVRLNTPGGFGAGTLTMLNRRAQVGGFVVIYGHPHSIREGSFQDESYLVPLLQQVQRLHDAGSIRICLPRELGRRN